MFPIEFFYFQQPIVAKPIFNHTLDVGRSLRHSLRDSVWNWELTSLVRFRRECVHFRSGAALGEQKSARAVRYLPV